jgi:hypothetical protein
VKRYHRKLRNLLAKILRMLYDTGGTEKFVHGPTLVRGTASYGGDFGKLSHFNLIEEKPGRREDSGRTGYWRVTPRGKEFLQGKIRIPKYALTYNAKVEDYDDQEMVTINELAPEFRLDDLMDNR